MSKAEEFKAIREDIELLRDEIKKQMAVLVNQLEALAEIRSLCKEIESGNGDSQHAASRIMQLMNSVDQRATQ